jgi:hypothetical protein
MSQHGRVNVSLVENEAAPVSVAIVKNEWTDCLVFLLFFISIDLELSERARTGQDNANPSIQIISRYGIAFGIPFNFNDINQRSIVKSSERWYSSKEICSRLDKHTILSESTLDHHQTAVTDVMSCICLIIFLAM